MALEYIDSTNAVIYSASGDFNIPPANTHSWIQLFLIIQELVQKRQQKKLV
jgi:hypothetical protein